MPGIASSYDRDHLAALASILPGDAEQAALLACDADLHDVARVAGIGLDEPTHQR
jgi:hypothetical protein